MYLRVYSRTGSLACQCLAILQFLFMQEFLRREVKPKTKDELINGILQYWATVTAAKCQRYISHLNKVIPEIIRVEGEATGF